MKPHIYNYLKSNPKPVKRRELLVHIRVIMGAHITDRLMRKTIEQMILVDGYTIQSSEKGYSLITTEQQLFESMKYLESKAESIAIRKNCLLRNFRNKFKKEPVLQTSLFQ
ncbi:MAG: hypothetical protein AABY22_08315 [Nanoarchaeota archaeon]